MSGLHARSGDARPVGVDDLLDAYRAHCGELRLKREVQVQRVSAAARFFERLGDPASWMERPVEVRLRDLDRLPGAWPFVAFLLASARLRADFELLARKHAGQSFSRSVAVCHREDLARLFEAAARLGWKDSWRKAVLQEMLPLAIAHSGVAPLALRDEHLDHLAAAIASTPHYTASVRRAKQSHLHSLRRLCYEAGGVERPAVRIHGGGPGNLSARLSVVAAPEIRRVMLAYLETRRAVLRPNSIRHLTGDLACFGEFLSDRFPALSSLAQLERAHLEAFLIYLPTRGWRGAFKSAGQPISTATVHETLIGLRTFLEDLRAWGWREAPARPVLLATDIPRLPDTLPRALAPGIDHALMLAVEELEDPFARIGIRLLRRTGIRIGELLSLELSCVTDYGPQGFWLKVPLGKLNSERSVPLDAEALQAIEEWQAQRSPCRALPNERDGRMTDFLFVEHGHLLSARRIEEGLRKAVLTAGLTGSDGKSLRVVPHQLRHTYATELLNAGISIPALMALLGHKTPAMALRYARLASSTLRRSYEEAIGKLRPRIPIAFDNLPPVPEKVDWLASEMLKTRLPHGYCARELVAGPCPYANICEQCAYFTTTSEFAPVLEDQLADVTALRQDATARGWDDEAARHDRVARRLQRQLTRLKEPSPGPTRA